jgi:predicted XRE-type DNA-binding protein
MKINELIYKWGLNQTILAKKIGVSRSSFSVKARQVNGQRFTETQKAVLEFSIKEMIEDLKNVEIEN